MLLIIDFSSSHESCIDDLSTHSFHDPTKKNRGYHVLPGGSRRCQVPVSVSNRISEANCQLPLTLPPKEGDRDNQVSFLYTLSSLEQRISMSHHPSLVWQKAVFTVFAMASRFSQLAVCHCHSLWSTQVFTRFHSSWWSVIPSGPWRCQERLSVAVDGHKTRYKHACTSLFIECLCYF